MKSRVRKPFSTDVELSSCALVWFMAGARQELKSQGTQKQKARNHLPGGVDGFIFSADLLRSSTALESIW
jgi:hypothetical protein